MQDLNVIVAKHRAIAKAKEQVFSAWRALDPDAKIDVIGRMVGAIETDSALVARLEPSPVPLMPRVWSPASAPATPPTPPDPVLAQLRALCDAVSEPASQARGGRPRVPLRDVLYWNLARVYSGSASRKVPGETSIAVSTLLRYLNHPTVGMVLRDMTPPGEADAETLSLILARFGPLKSAGQTARANEFLCRRIVWDLL